MLLLRILVLLILLVLVLLILLVLLLILLILLLLLLLLLLLQQMLGKSQVVPGFIIRRIVPQRFLVTLRGDDYQDRDTGIRFIPAERFLMALV